MGVWEGRKVLVTGAGGFVGAWLAKELVGKGAKVSAFCLRKDEAKPLRMHGIAGKVARIEGDLTKSEDLAFLRSGDFDTCFHLAAQALVLDANRSPTRTFEVNITGTWNLLEACRNSKSIERVIVASSDKAYGEQPRLPYTEDMPLLGAGPYDASKACADILTRSYAKSYGLPATVTRCANIYGGGDPNLSRIVPGTIISVLRGDTPVIRSDGKLVRDYIYAGDAVAGYLALAEKTAGDGISGEAFNFGTGKPTTVLELFRQVMRACGSSA